jgi:uncharacterized protein (DUF3820 family)
MNKPFDDQTPMPFGKYTGKKLIEVPAHYLIWLHENNKCFGELKKYIEDNMDVLKQEVKK